MIGLNAGAVAAWIDTLELGQCGSLLFSRIGHGQSNLTFLVTDEANGRWVLRRPPLGSLEATAHDIAREHRILTALQGTAVPTPRVHGLCTDPEVSDVPLLLMEHVDGLVVDEMAVAHALSPSERFAIALEIVGALGQIHAVDLRSTGLDTLASHAPYAERQLNRWQRQWESVRVHDRPGLDEVGRRLRASMPPESELTLVHGDFHLQNVIVAPDASSVRAVLDWELCTLGDPLADLGGMLANWPQPGDPAEAVFPAATLPGFPSREQLAETYSVVTGRSLETVPFWHVLGLWKIAIISEGVLRRAQDNPDNAVPVGTWQAVDDMIVRALAVADEAGI